MSALSGLNGNDLNHYTSELRKKKDSYTFMIMNKEKSEIAAIQRMVIEESILIHAEMDKVWKIFTNLTCWNEWNTVMSDVCSNEKCLSNESEISCCFRSFLFSVSANIIVEEVVPYKRIVWSAKKKGFFARNEFSFQNHSKGVTVTSREAFTGMLVRVFGFLLPKKRMKTLIATFLSDLKTASENHNYK